MAHRVFPNLRWEDSLFVTVWVPCYHALWRDLVVPGPLCEDILNEECSRPQQSICLPISQQAVAREHDSFFSVASQMDLTPPGQIACLGLTVEPVNTQPMVHPAALRAHLSGVARDGGTTFCTAQRKE